MWSGKRETDLTKLLDTPALGAKPSRFLLATAELLQFRHRNEIRASESDDDVNLEGEALVKDGW